MIVRAALDLAVQRRLLDHNVAHSAHGWRRGPGTAPARVWSTAELAAFLAAARGRRLGELGERRQTARVRADSACW